MIVLELNTKENSAIFTVINLTLVLTNFKKMVLAATVLTLRGSSYVSYRVYDWKDRVHSSVTRFSMLFKTRFDNSALLYAAGGIFRILQLTQLARLIGIPLLGEHGIDHYIAASIFNETVHVVMDFGLNSPVTIILGTTPDFKLHEWNNLTIFHEHEKIHVILNDEIHTINITGSPLLYIDPEIYIGLCFYSYGKHV